MVISDIFTSGDCYIGDPSDGSHGGRQTRSCRHCRRLHCENHAVFSEGQRFCVRCRTERLVVRVTVPLTGVSKTAEAAT